MLSEAVKEYLSALEKFPAGLSYDVINIYLVPDSLLYLLPPSRNKSF